MASKTAGKGAASKLVQPILSFSSGKAATTAATPSVQLGSSRNLVQSIETTPTMQRDWSLASSSSSSSSQIDPVQSESPLTPKQAQKRARESDSPPQAHQNPPTAPLDDAAVESNEFNCDLSDLAAVFDGSQHKAQMIMSFIQRTINQSNQQHGEAIQVLLRDRESKIAEQEHQIEQQRVEIQELRQIIKHGTPAASNGPPAVTAPAAWQVQQRGAAPSRGGKRVGRGGAVVGSLRSTPATNGPASYAAAVQQTSTPNPVRQFPSYAEKLKQAKQEQTAAAQAASNLELLADLKKQQERRTNPPIRREPVEYKSFIIENPLGNRTRFVQNPLRRIRSILADEYKVPRTIREISYIGAAKSTLEIFIKVSDYDDAITKLSTPLDPSLPSIFVTSNLAQVPDHRVFGLPPHLAPSEQQMEEALVRRRAVMLERALRERVPVMCSVATSNVDSYLKNRIYTAALILFESGSLKPFLFPNDISRTNLDALKAAADNLIRDGELRPLEASAEQVNLVAKRCELPKEEAKQQVKNFIRAFPLSALAECQAEADS
ncbi:hypothetical protein BJ741DRAFT_593077 [Chytriomyces cf. hyalinus JEL632]|nr:hypothetical protein BJ741DRAFT_593077 [Chytriomyces cf. hyalinus JEL632]